ncbi:UNVERIFIED_CONTAM: hypothetical protein FKN15_019960 [Acipenser sinensis]
MDRPQQTPVNAVATRKSLRLQRLDPVEAPVPEQQDYEEEKVRFARFHFTSEDACRNIILKIHLTRL